MSVHRGLRSFIARSTALGLIAWTSVALILISCFPRLSEDMGWLWLATGAMGLVSAVGLAEAEKTRLQEQRTLFDNVLREAYTDPLTGLVNRRGFEQELAARCAAASITGQPLWLLMIDLDHFKRINDVHGHQAGDEVLRGVARMLSHVMRQDDLVCRYGGEEIAVLVRDVSEEVLQRIIARTRLAIAACGHRHRGQLIHVTLSGGAASHSPEGSPTDLIRQADSALYAAKEGGRNAFFLYAPEGSRNISEPAVEMQVVG